MTDQPKAEASATRNPGKIKTSGCSRFDFRSGHAFAGMRWGSLTRCETFDASILAWVRLGFGDGQQLFHRHRGSQNTNDLAFPVQDRIDSTPGEGIEVHLL